MAGHINRISATKPQGRWITNDKEHSYRLYSDFYHIVGTTSSYARPKALALGRVAFVGGHAAFVMAVLCWARCKA